MRTSADPSSASARKFDVRDYAMAAGTFLASLMIYLSTLAPSVTTEDSGELIAAAFELGVPHPPGFPLWVLLVHWLMTLSPWSAAWTANAASALFGAATVGFVTLVARRVGATRSAASAAALLLAVGQTFWTQSVIAEVYTLNTALLAMALLALVGYGEDLYAPAQPLRVAALIGGLAVCNHYPLALLATPPIFLYIVTPRPTRFSFSPLMLASLVALVALPLVLYLYLPWAARRGPAMNWGEPATAEAFWFHVSRGAYRTLELSSSPAMADKLSFMRDYFVGWLREATPVPILLGVLPGVWALRRRASLLLLLLGVAFFNGIVLLLLLQFDYEHENIIRVNEYYLPTYVVGAVLAAAGFDRTLDRIPAISLRPALLLLPCVVAFTTFANVDRANDHLAEDFNRAILSTLPKNAIYFPSGDYVSFPSVYLQAVEGLRPDVLLANYTGTPSPELKSFARTLDPSVDISSPSSIQLAILERSDRPVCFASKSDLRVSNLHLYPWGFVYRVRRRYEPRPLPAPKPSLGSLRNSQAPAAGDDLGRALLADAHRAAGEWHALHGERAEALDEFKAAASWLSTSKEGLNNLGSTLAELDFVDEALGLYKDAAALGATYVTPRRNLAFLLAQHHRQDEAIAAFRELVEIAQDDDGARQRLDALIADQSRALERVARYEAAVRESPGLAPLWNNLGTALVEAGRTNEAREAYLEAVRLDPEYQLAHRHLAALYREFFHNEVRARAHESRLEALRKSP